MMNPLVRRFAVAHELGHLLLHPDAAPGSPDHEMAADAFAAEFLMPAAELCDLFPANRDVAALKELSDCYGVPTAVLAHRGHLLGVYTETSLRVSGLLWSAAAGQTTNQSTQPSLASNRSY